MRVYQTTNCIRIRDNGCSGYIRNFGGEIELAVWRDGHAEEAMSIIAHGGRLSRAAVASSPAVLMELLHQARIKWAGQRISIEAMDDHHWSAYSRLIKKYAGKFGYTYELYPDYRFAHLYW